MFSNKQTLDFLNASFSKTPYGPFHTMVLALAIILTKTIYITFPFSMIVFYPLSKPINPYGIPLSTVHNFTFICKI
jgi:hypothetical protein